MLNVPQIQARLKEMSQQQLFQAGQDNANDALMFSLINNENQNRQKMRASAMAPQAGQQPPVVAQDLAKMAPPSAMPNMPAGIPLQGPGSAAQMQQLPENTGIGALPAQNLTKMADGGITGYAAGSEDAIKGDYSPAFMQNFYNVLNAEGGPNTDTGGYTKYGISQKYHPNIDVSKLTKDDAARIYKKEYWDKINGDRLHAVNPALAGTLFDAAVNQGVDKARGYLTASNGDPNKVMDLRRADYNALVASNPKTYGKYEAGWNKRLDELSNNLGLAQASQPTQQAPQQAQPQQQGVLQALKSGQGPMQFLQGVGDTAYNIAGFPMDVSHQITKVFGNTTPEENVVGTSAYFKKKATEAGIRPPDVADPTLQGYRKVGELGGAFLTPGGVGKTAEAGISGLESLGMRAANRFNPAPQITPGGLADLQKLQEETAIRNAQGAGATVEEQDYLRDMMNRNNASNAPALADIPFKTQQAAPTRADMLGLARTGGAGIPLSQDTQFQGPTPTKPASNVAGPGEAGWGMDLGQEPVPGGAAPAADKQASDVTAQAPAKGGRDWNDFLLNLGLGLMAGKSPYALQNLGEAGIGALKQEQEQKKMDLEERKQKALEDLQATQGRYYGAYAKAIEEGAKGKDKQFEADQIIEKELAANKMPMDFAERAAERRRLQAEIYPRYGITGTMPQVDTAGFKFIGSRPGP